MNYFIQFNSGIRVFVCVACLKNGKMKRKLMKLWIKYLYLFSSFSISSRSSLHLCISAIANRHTFLFSSGEHWTSWIWSRAELLHYFVTTKNIWKDKEDCGFENIITVILCFVSGWRWNTYNLSFFLKRKALNWTFIFTVHSALCYCFPIEID